MDHLNNMDSITKLNYQNRNAQPRFKLNSVQRMKEFHQPLTSNQEQYKHYSKELRMKGSQSQRIVGEAPVESYGDQNQNEIHILDNIEVQDQNLNVPKPQHANHSSMLDHIGSIIDHNQFTPNPKPALRNKNYSILNEIKVPRNHLDHHSHIDRNIGASVPFEKLK